MADSTKAKTKKTTVAAKAPAKKTASPAPATKAASTAKPAAKPAAPKKAAAKAASRPPREVGDEQKRNYIEVAAYYIAEAHGFTAGRELEDWAEAEAKIDRLLSEGLLNP